MVPERTEDQPVEQLSRQLIPFIDELRRDGYNIGVGEYLGVHHLLVNLSAMGEIDHDLEPLGRYLAPLICSNAEELTDFKHRFAAWAQWFRPETVRPPEPPEPETRIVEDLTLSTKSGNPLIWLAAALVLMCVFAGIYLLASDMTGSLLQPEQIQVDEPLQARFKQPSIYVYSILAGLLATLLAWGLWWGRRAKSFLSRRSSARTPRLETLRVQKSETSLFRSIQFLKTSQAMRKRYEIDSKHLDILATIQKTVNNCGIFSPVRGVRQVSPEYLILVDRSTFLDHQTQYVDTLVDRLKENDVFFHRYYFFQDPRLCFPANEEEEPLDLGQLAVRHPNHRLLIFSNGQGMVDPLSGTPAEWIDLFDPWPNRALMPLETKNNRAGIDAVLTSSGFTVLPAGEPGMFAYIKQIQHGRFPRTRFSDLGRRYPHILHENPDVWLDRHEPPREQVEALLTQLQVFLGKDGFDWLAACAVYPQIEYDLTVFLARQLQTEHNETLFNETTLKALAQLPWFKEGRMPDWLRERLLARMSRPRENEVRCLLHALLLTALDENKEGFDLTYATLKEKGIQSFQKHIFKRIRSASDQRSPMQDYVFATFMENPLSVRIPRQLGHILRPDPKESRSSLSGFTDAADLFSRPGLGTMAVFIALGILAGLIRFSNYEFRFSTESVQFFLVILAGYRYGPRIGLLCGALVFVPNLLLYFLPAVHPGNSTVFQGFFRLNDEFRLVGLSPVSYLLHLSMGGAAAALRASLSQPPHKSEAARGIYLLWIPIYLTAFSLDIDSIQLYFLYIFGPILMLIAFHVGLKQAFILLIGYLPLTLFQVSLGSLRFGGTSSSELIMLLTSIILASHMKVMPPARLRFKSILFSIMLLVSVVLSFTFLISENIQVAGYPMALAMTFTAGILFGPRQGYRFGMIWGITTGFFSIALTDILKIGGEWWFATLAAPVVGYWAGTLKFDRVTSVFGPAVRFFSGLYLFRLFIKLLAGSTYLPGYYQIPISWMESTVAVVVFLFMLQKFRIKDLDRGTTGLALPESGELFKPVKKIGWVFLTLAGMISIFQVSFDFFSLRVDLFQYVIVISLGYYFGRRPALLAGLFIFLPNLIYYYVPDLMSSVAEPRNFMFYRVNLNGIKLLGFSIIAYMIHAFLGYGTAFLKERLAATEKDRPPAEFEKEKPTWTYVVMIILMYITSFQLYFSDIFRVNFSSLYYPFLLYIAFSRGTKFALKAFWFTFPIVLASLYFGPLSLGIGMSGSGFIMLMLALILADVFGRQARAIPRTSFGPLFYLFLFLCVASAFSYTISRHVHIPGYTLSFGFVFAAGAMCGRRQGFYLGLVAGSLAALVRFDLSEVIRFGGAWWFALLAMPLIGYIGGGLVEDAKRSRFLNALYVLGVVYLIELILYFLQGRTGIEAYMNLPFCWILSVMAAYVLFLFDLLLSRLKLVGYRVSIKQEKDNMEKVAKRVKK